MIEVLALVALFWAIFQLGKLWEYDHPREERPPVWDDVRDSLPYDMPWDEAIATRPGPYDQEFEDR